MFNLKEFAIASALFFVLSPGGFLTLPPKSGSLTGLFGKGILSSKETHWLAIICHTVIFSGLFGAYMYFLSDDLIVGTEVAVDDVDDADADSADAADADSADADSDPVDSDPVDDGTNVDAE